MHALWLHYCSSAGQHGHVCKNDTIDGIKCEPTVCINFTHHSVPASIFEHVLTVAWAGHQAGARLLSRPCVCSHDSCHMYVAQVTQLWCQYHCCSNNHTGPGTLLTAIEYTLLTAIEYSDMDHASKFVHGTCIPVLSCSTQMHSAMLFRVKHLIQ